ncbi:MAG TPA: alpha/beta hydrolase [Novosphingobium sp.]|nr:alpha/beta hydrolase [Novosphingobium sp.]
MSDGELNELARFLQGWPERQLAQTRGLKQLRQVSEEVSRSIPLPPECRTEEIASDAVTGELILPKGADGSAAILFHHGGGHVFGSPAEHRHMVARIAEAAGLPAFNMGYPLAPEHPFPAGLDQALANYRFVLDRGVAPDRLIVVGDSAGGNLTAAMLLRAAKAGLPMPVGAYLLSPWLDLANVPVTHDLRRDPLLVPEALKVWAEWYCGGQDLFHPEISPLFATLEKFPSTLIHVGGAESLLAESLAFTRKLAEAGRSVQLSVHKDMVHAWPLFHADLPLASAAAFGEFAEWARRLLAG